MQSTTIMKLKSCSDFPPLFDLKYHAGGGIGQVLLYNNDMAPAVRTFSSVYFKLHGNTLKLSEDMQRQLEGTRKVATIPNAFGHLFHEIKSHSALSLQSKEAFGNDMLQLGQKRVSSMDFPQR